MLNPKPRCPALVAVATTKSFLDAPDGGCIGLTSMLGASVQLIAGARPAGVKRYLVVRSMNASNLSEGQQTTVPCGSSQSQDATTGRRLVGGPTRSPRLAHPPSSCGDVSICEPPGRNMCSSICETIQAARRSTTFVRIEDANVRPCRVLPSSISGAGRWTCAGRRSQGDGHRLNKRKTNIHAVPVQAATIHAV